VTGRRFGAFLAVVCSLALVMSMSVRVTRAQQPTGAPPAPGQTAGQRFKNVQVLKDIPADQLLLTMQYVAASLGVQCNFCHVQGANELDDKETKKAARKMMKMVNAVNETQFEGRAVLSCASCHNGRSKPLRTPPLVSELTPEEAARVRAGRGRGFGPGGPQGAPVAGGQRGEGRGRGPAEPAAPPKPTETVDQVADKYLQALGGRQALENAKTRVMTGTVTSRDLQSFPVTVQEKSTGEYRIEIAAQPNPTIRAFNGKSGWSVGGFNNQVRDLEGFQLQQGLRLADLTVPLHLSERYEGLAVSRYADVDGKAAIVLTGRPYPDVSEQLFFDRDTGLLLRRSVATRTGLGELPEQIDYSDYREVNGVKVPFTVRHATWNNLTTEKLAEVKLNAPVGDDQFAKPPAK
jgi:photosynthetic reaction center cytochrome c subunit